MRNFSLSEQLLGKIAEGNGIGTAIVKGIDQGRARQQVRSQQRTENRQAEDTLKMKKAEFNQKSEAHRITVAKNQRLDDMYAGRQKAIATLDKKLWIANDGDPSEFDQLGTLDEQKAEEVIRDSGDRAYSENVMIGGIPFTQAFNAQAEEIGDPAPIPVTATSQAAKFNHPEFGELLHKGMIVNSDNLKVGGGFVSKSGDIFVNDGVGVRKITAGETLTTLTQANNTYITGAKFIEVDEAVTADEISFKNIQNYLGSRDEAGQGIELMVDKFTNHITTIFGGKITNDEQFAAAKANGQLQILLGAFRESVLGPGAMTEFDALRVLDGLGGNLGLLQNKEVVGVLLTNMLENKYKTYIDNHLPTYNYNAARNQREQKEPIEIDFDRYKRESKATIVTDDDGVEWVWNGKDSKDLKSSYIRASIGN
tara:strand:+ start:5825 stop:7096 length:1272 start_codon:yes stop_codon:yes gene_type:complete